MSSTNKVKMALWVMAALFVVGGLCYAAFPVGTPDEPVRIPYKSSAGNVVFTHGMHAADYGQDCISCHHNIDEDEIYDCRQCHRDGGKDDADKDEDLPNMTDSLHSQCIGCHEDAGAGPVECNACHRSR